MYNLCLMEIEDHILAQGGQTLDNYNLPVIDRTTAANHAQEYVRYANFDVCEQNQYINNHEHQLTANQREIYALFLDKVNTQRCGITFVDAPGGTGKTFLLNLILAKIRSNGHIAIATASSGIAATLLTGGRTLHSAFKVPLNAHKQDTPTCSMKKGTAIARVMNEAKAIIVDEAPMTHRAVYEAIDRTLQDICGNSKPFGGIPVMFCGDFRQILPVVKQGTRANIVDATLKRSPLWRNVTTYRLHDNIRAQLTNDPTAANYADLLMNIGDGNYPVENKPDTITLPEGIHQHETPSKLIEEIYVGLTGRAPNDNNWLLERAILAPLNETVDAVNSTVIDRFPGEVKIYNAINTTLTPEEAVHFPVEFLNSIEISGIPPHKLKLKVGCPVIVLRSLDPPNIMNGTRCTVYRMSPNVIEVILINGPAAGKHALIPRIPLIPSDSDLPFQFRRLQFPLRPCFAMTINKAQGQTFSIIGLDLRSPVFSHGMLYVAASRVGSRSKLHVHAPDKKTRNVVFKNVLQ